MNNKRKLEDNSNKYSRRQRISYFATRHAIFFIALIPSVLYLRTIDDGALLALLATRIARSALGISMAIMFAKFAFPKLDVQKEVDDGNMAIAILFAAIIIGVNL